MQAYDPSKEELVHVAGDMDTGVSTDVHLNRSALAHPQIRYKGRYGDWVITGDLYAYGDELMLHIICPSCRHALKISSARKSMQWDSEKGISVEPSKCSWEKGRDTDNTVADRMEFGVGLCNWTFAIDNNIAKDA